MRKTLEGIFNEDRQRDGVAMGSPLGPHLANISCDTCKRDGCENCAYEFKPIFYTRYVDDTFLLLYCNSHVEFL